MDLCGVGACSMQPVPSAVCALCGLLLSVVSHGGGGGQTSLLLLVTAKVPVVFEATDEPIFSLCFVPSAQGCA